MVHLGILRILQVQLSMEWPSAIIPSWQLEIVEGSLNQLTMEQIGVIQLLELQENSMQLPSGTIPLWQWDQLEPFLPPQMELRGPLELLELQILSMESPLVNKY